MEREGQALVLQPEFGVQRAGDAAHEGEHLLGDQTELARLLAVEHFIGQALGLPLRIVKAVAVIADQNGA